MYKYLVYPEAVKKLTDAGLVARFEERKDDEDFYSPFGFISHNDLVAISVNLRDTLYSKLPKSERIEFQRKISAANLMQQPWKIKANPNQVTKQETEHIELMLGYPASYILTPDEVDNYQNFGFNSFVDLIGSFSAYIHSELYMNSRGPLEWKATHPDGRSFRKAIGGSLDYDLWITDQDITPYPTLDPAGYNVSYRPFGRWDDKVLAFHHSVEPTFLALILKWINQVGIKSDLLENQGCGLIDFARNLGQIIGATTEHLCPNSQHPIMNFALFDSPMKRVGEDFSKLPRPDTMYEESTRIPYVFLIGSDNELVISRFDKNLEERTRYYPNEVDDVLKSLFYQAAKGFGRTPVAELIANIHYRFSQQFVIDQEKLVERLSRS